MLCAVFLGVECLLRFKVRQSDPEVSDDLRFWRLLVFCSSGEEDAAGLTG
jgi:hypothetical protein